MTLDSDDVRFMRIFAGGPWKCDVIQQWGNRKRVFGGFGRYRTCKNVDSDSWNLRVLQISQGTNTAKLGRLSIPYVTCNKANNHCRTQTCETMSWSPENVQESRAILFTTSIRVAKLRNQALELQTYRRTKEFNAKKAIQGHSRSRVLE